MPTSNEELLQQQLEASSGKKPKGVEPAKAVGISYNADLQRVVREIKRDIDTYLVPLLRKLAPEYVTDSVRTTDSYVDTIVSTLRMLLDKWSSPQFRSLSERLARGFVTSADRVNAKRFDAQFPTFGIDIFGGSTAMQDYLSASVFDNTRLITSIPEQYLGLVDSIVMTNVRAGHRPSAIVKTLQEQFGITKNRAKLIARDQTAKINGDLTEQRQRSVGYEYFQWLDSDDSRVRTRHESIANKVTQYGLGIYRWDNLPLSDKGVPIKPGQDYQCRCIARPVGQDEVDENVKAGRTRPGVKR
jgi:SPP1 gp7 family putative phage head morphogenesis protein